MLRGGAFKPRSSPYAFQGLGLAALEMLAEVRAETGLPIVTEVMDTRQVEQVGEYADMLQIGARNMQNFSLLSEVGRIQRPVLLKRGLSATIKELLMAAEYIMAQGNRDVILCERGIRTYETATRNTLDIAAIPVLKRETHLPVMVDPSHAGGRADLVAPLAFAAIAAGADGLIEVEVHGPVLSPRQALSDGDQSLTLDALRADCHAPPPPLRRCRRGRPALRPGHPRRRRRGPARQPDALPRRRAPTGTDLQEAPDDPSEPRWRTEPTARDQDRPADRDREHSGCPASGPGPFR
jgi:3-deoxy-7-phosphoheptulonate synthase